MQRMLFLACFLSAVSLLSAGSIETHAQAPDLAVDAFSLAVNDEFLIHGLELEEHKGEESLILQRFLVFHPEAKVVVYTAAGEARLTPPNHVYFQGYVAGRPHSRVFLTIAEDGDYRGLVAEQGQLWSLRQAQTRGAGPSLAALPLPPEQRDAMPPFVCGADELAEIPADPVASTNPPPDQLAVAGDLIGATYYTTIAVEGDYEFVQRKGGREGALDYVGDLIGFTSIIYQRELATQVLVGDVFLWETEDDPWNAESTGAQLTQFRDYWRDNREEVNRTLATFLSSRGLGGGVAWVGQLCSRGNGYSVSANLSGGFNFDNPRSVWDIVVVAHELGHNFGSGHTHCYSPPIDKCYDQCTSEPKVLPCEQRGGGCGTILSYCHLLSGGMSNIGLTMGLDHIYGDQPERVPGRMAAHVASVAGRAPECLPTICDAPVIVQQPSDQVLCLNDNAALSINVDGTDLQYQWRKNGAVINGADGPSLSLGLADADDAGAYYCVISSACGDLVSNSVTVSVAGPSVAVHPRVALQSLGTTSLSGSIGCIDAQTPRRWFNVTANAAINQNGLDLTLPRLNETSLIELRIGEGSAEAMVASALVLVSADERYEDADGDGCNGIGDLHQVLQDWRERVTVDPNMDGVIDVRDYLFINISQTCD